MAAISSAWEWVQDMNSLTFSLKVPTLSSSKVSVSFYSCFIKVNFEGQKSVTFLDLAEEINPRSPLNTFKMEGGVLTISTKKAKSGFWPELHSKKSKEVIRQLRESAIKEEEEHQREKAKEDKAAREKLASRAETEAFEKREEARRALQALKDSEKTKAVSDLVGTPSSESFISEDYLSLLKAKGLGDAESFGPRREILGPVSIPFAAKPVPHLATRESQFLVPPQAATGSTAPAALAVREHADRLLKSGDLRGAIAAYGEALKTEPTSLPTIFNLSIVLLKTCEFEPCLAACEKFAEIFASDPNRAKVPHFLAMLAKSEQRRAFCLLSLAEPKMAAEVLEECRVKFTELPTPLDDDLKNLADFLDKDIEIIRKKIAEIDEPAKNETSNTPSEELEQLLKLAENFDFELGLKTNSSIPLLQTLKSALKTEIERLNSDSKEAEAKALCSKLVKFDPLDLDSQKLLDKFRRRENLRIAEADSESAKTLMAQGSFEKALKLFIKADKVFSESRESFIETLSVITNMTACHSAVEDFHSALRDAERGLRLLESRRNNFIEEGAQRILAKERVKIASIEKMLLMRRANARAQLGMVTAAKEDLTLLLQKFPGDENATAFLNQIKA